MKDICNLLSRIINKVKVWYRGKYVKHKTDPTNRTIRLIDDHYEKSSFAKCLQYIGGFWIKHWGKLIGFIIAIGIFIMAVLNYLKK